MLIFLRKINLAIVVPVYIISENALGWWRGNARTDAFADRALVMQRGVEPFRHLALPVRDVG